MPSGLSIYRSLKYCIKRTRNAFRLCIPLSNALFAMQSHLMGEVMDIKPDRMAKRKTTATVLGVVKTKMLIIFIVLLELIVLYFYFNEYIFTAILSCGLVWLFVDLLIIFKNRTYSLFQMRLFGIASNVIAIISIIYVWHSGCLIV